MSFDPAKLPEVLTPKQLGEVLSKTESALANDRHTRRGIPYTKVGARVYYLREDVLKHLAANRVETAAQR